MQKADYTNIAELRAAADTITEMAGGLVTYLGFFKASETNPVTDPVAAKAAPCWSILKIEQSGLVKPIDTDFLWANGLCLFNLVWNNKEGYNYTFKKF
jgi:hypothetical protein